MAIYGIGAYYDDDISQDFLNGNFIGIGWGRNEAPELHQFISYLKVGDIVYIKSVSPRSADIIVRGIGFIRDNIILDSSSTLNLAEIGRNMLWHTRDEFRIIKPDEKNNVRLNTMYEENHPTVQAEIMNHLF